ncbi:uncharacterized protein BO66DRAFT_440496 [Aspergillus aculeatinus CBS 121060]|uniref:Uncharacterized protein n=1 Tax=Aspergillus aculeatinus CBS 121060 TaxID=1448322 RepID=A0ACD1H3N7_9EURO|nr:hypothetical protein BO66DRAFT_440496 [Aspergillus aculeatinus CBS 121060]RAH68114.1 hypothetical protein BO66DRAFT_440496 [Aspergillus aculeatinus CBS 121060]
MPPFVHNSLGPEMTEGVGIPKLEAKLHELFGKYIRVTLSGDFYVFDAPRQVTRSSPENPKTHVFHADDNNSNHPMLFIHSYSLERYITTSSKPRLRIVHTSLSAPVQQELFTFIDSAFFNLALAFGGKPMQAAGSCEFGHDSIDALLVHMLPLYDDDDEEIQRRSVLDPQNVGDKVSSLAVRLTVTLQTVQQLSHVYRLLHHPEPSVPPVLDCYTFADELSSYEADLTASLHGARILENELQGIANSLSVAVNFKVNRQMLKLGTESFDDSSTVKSMTLVALIYLPASFVSSILGMNLFDFDGGGQGGFTISKQFWIFVVLAVPLTLLTLASWYVIARRTRKARERKTEEEG